MSTNVGGIEGSVGLDVTQLERAQQEVENSFEGMARGAEMAQKEMEQLDRSANSTEVEQVGRDSEQAASGMEQAEGASHQLEDALEQTAEVIDRLDSLAESMSMNEVADQSAKAEREVRDLGRAADQTESESSSLAGTLKTVVAGAAIGAVVDRGKEAIKVFAEWQIEMAKTAGEAERMSKTINVSSGEYQELQAVFSEFGMEGADVRDVLATISERAVDAKNGAKGVREDFNSLGISVEELKGKDPAELFDLVARRISETEDPTRALKGAVSILGDEMGQKLVARLAGTDQSLEDVTEKLREAGVVMDEQAIDKAAETEKQWKSLSRQWKGFKRQQLQNTDSLFNKVTGSMAGLLDTATVTNEELKEQSEDFRRLADTVDEADKVIKRGRARLERMRETIESIKAPNIPKTEMELIEDMANKSRDETEAGSRVAAALGVQIEKLKGQKIGVDSAVRRAELDRQIADLKADQLELQAEDAETQTEKNRLLQRAANLRKQALEDLREARKEAEKMEQKDEGKAIAKKVAGKAKTVADDKQSGAVGSAVSAAMGATGGAREKGQDAASNQAEVLQARRNRNAAEAKRQWEKHSAEAKQTEKTQADLAREAREYADNVQTGLGHVKSMTTEIAGAAGASRQLQSGLEGAFSVAQGISKLSMLSSASNPVLAGLAGISTVVGGIAQMASGGQETGTQNEPAMDQQRRRRDKRLAELIGKEVGENVERTRETIFVEDNNTRRSNRDPSRQETREQGRRLAREAKLNPGGV